MASCSDRNCAGEGPTVRISAFAAMAKSAIARKERSVDHDAMAPQRRRGRRGGAERPWRVKARLSNGALVSTFLISGFPAILFVSSDSSDIGRAHVCTPVTYAARTQSIA